MAATKKFLLHSHFGFTNEQDHLHLKNYIQKLWPNVKNKEKLVVGDTLFFCYACGFSTKSQQYHRRHIDYCKEIEVDDGERPKLVSEKAKPKSLAGADGPELEDARSWTEASI